MKLNLPWLAQYCSKQYLSSGAASSINPTMILSGFLAFWNILLIVSAHRSPSNKQNMKNVVIHEQAMRRRANLPTRTYLERKEAKQKCCRLLLLLEGLGHENQCVWLSLPLVSIHGRRKRERPTWSHARCLDDDDDPACVACSNVAVTSHGHYSLILSQQQQQQHDPSTYCRSSTGSAICPMLMRQSRMIQEYSSESRSSLLRNLRLSCQALNSDARSLLVIWEILYVYNQTMLYSEC
jgi:hypothetical protein